MRYRAGQALWVWSDFDNEWRAAIVCPMGSTDSHGHLLVDTANDDVFRFPPDYQGDNVKRIRSWDKWLNHWTRDCYLWLVRRELRSVKALATAKLLWEVIDQHRSPNTSEHCSDRSKMKRTKFYWGDGK